MKGANGAHRHLHRGRGRRLAEDGRPAARLLARQPALAHRRLFPGSAGPLFDAARQGHSARRRRHRVRRHARRLRRTAIGDEGIDPRDARAPLDRLLATDARLRLLEGRGGSAQGRRPPARSYDSALGPARALRGVTRLAHHRLARARGTPAAARPHRARHPASVRLSP